MGNLTVVPAPINGRTPEINFENLPGMKQVCLGAAMPFYFIMHFGIAL